MLTIFYYKHSDMGNVVCCQQTADIDNFFDYYKSQASPVYLEWLQNIPVSSAVYIKGDWGQSSLQTGKGIILSPERLYYQGEIIDGFPSGKGKAVWSNHTIFIGDFEQSVANGQGELIFTDDDVSLIGSWINGKIEINKKMVLTYKGKKALITFLVKEFNTNSKQSQEVEHKSQDSLYVQLQFQDNGAKYLGDVKFKTKGYQIDGEGQITFKDGSFYHGDFLDGKIQGQGQYSWPNGHRYVGHYQNNLRHGQGRYYYSSNKWVEGIWKSGVLKPRSQLSQDFKQSNRREGGNTNQKQKGSKIGLTDEIQHSHD